MITKFFSKIVVKFDPFGPEAKCARSFISLISPKLRQTCPVDLEVLPKASTKSPLLKVTFKDKTSMEGNPAEQSFDDFAQMLDRHSRQLQFKEDANK
ncbi:hypothetical protein OGAPHI_006046 [Ogataea philodendri]|uniref:Large ribosomal subunit protein mL53 n=1 Tax=Ogataea philodendri TaxID=1378263 RepID=A0A9P8NYL6_9ASCO|nr:uncharacterized protein OGAPHI_006046 [Ogataea philodendri]KAH3661867.1 hypothetical protein OGAPHI_006046 [Ogataea philodendri]